MNPMQHSRTLVLLIAGGLSNGLAADPTVRSPQNFDGYFEPNLGQAAEDIRFIGRGEGKVMLSDREAVLIVERDGQTAPIRMRVDGKPAPTGRGFRGVQPLPGISGYFRGSDPAKWLRQGPHFPKGETSSGHEGGDSVQ